jgi:hypothetical protein
MTLALCVMMGNVTMFSRHVAVNVCKPLMIRLYVSLFQVDGAQDDPVRSLASGRSFDSLRRRQVALQSLLIFVSWCFIFILTLQHGIGTGAARGRVRMNKRCSLLRVGGAIFIDVYV